MTSVTIRPATLLDLTAVVEVEHQADAQFVNVDLGAVLDAPQAGIEDHAPAQAEGRLFVADDEAGRIDGEPHIEQVSVYPDAAGHRIGARLMDACEDWAMARGYKRMTLCTYRDVPWNGPIHLRSSDFSTPAASLGYTPQAHHDGGDHGAPLLVGSAFWCRSEPVHLLDRGRRAPGRLSLGWGRRSADPLACQRACSGRATVSLEARRW